eukprot:365224-Chlamydomonas_euryale.AAC.19
MRCSRPAGYVLAAHNQNSVGLKKVWSVQVFCAIPPPPLQPEAPSHPYLAHHLHTQLHTGDGRRGSTAAPLAGGVATRCAAPLLRLGGHLADPINLRSLAPTAAAAAVSAAACVACSHRSPSELREVAESCRHPAPEAFEQPDDPGRRVRRQQLPMKASQVVHNALQAGLAQLRPPRARAGIALAAARANPGSRSTWHAVQRGGGTSRTRSNTQIGAVACAISAISAAACAISCLCCNARAGRIRCPARAGAPCCSHSAGTCLGLAALADEREVAVNAAEHAVGVVDGRVQAAVVEGQAPDVVGGVSGLTVDFLAAKLLVADLLLVEFPAVEFLAPESVAMEVLVVELLAVGCTLRVNPTKTAQRPVQGSWQMLQRYACIYVRCSLPLNAATRRRHRHALPCAATSPAMRRHESRALCRNARSKVWSIAAPCLWAHTVQCHAMHRGAMRHAIFRCHALRHACYFGAIRYAMCDAMQDARHTAMRHYVLCHALRHAQCHALHHAL